MGRSVDVDVIDGSRCSVGRRRGQDGVTLVEMLVAIAILAILSVSATVGLTTLLTTSSRADLQSRTDAVVNGFGEVLKQIDYVGCATPSQYQQAFTHYEAALAPKERLLQRSDATVDITGLNAGTRCGENVDAGVQVINIRATVGSRSRAAQIVKRDPNASPNGPTAVIDTPVPQTGAGDVLYTVALTAKGSSASLGILRLDWDCGASAYVDASHSRTYTTYSLDDPTVLCTYAASAAATTATASLTVTDYGLATANATRSITVPAWASPPTGPSAKFTFAQASSSPLGPTYNPSTATFDASTSMSPSGSDLTYRWDFGDASSGGLNTSTLLKPTHVYYSPGTYTVTLVVTDDIGLYASVSHSVTVANSGKVSPVVTFFATPDNGVVPQTVSFNTTGTMAKSVGAVLVPSSYQWNFGDGQVGSGAAPTHLYSAAGTYTVTLTVTDSLGNVAATSRSVTYGAVVLPPGFTLTDAAGELAHDGHFYFAWTNVARSPGDTVTYTIEVQVTAGCLAFGSKSREVAAGAAGSNQTYDFRVSWPASNVCLGSRYKYRVQTKRVSATDGTTVISWSAWSTPFTIGHT